MVPDEPKLTFSVNPHPRQTVIVPPGTKVEDVEGTPYDPREVARRAWAWVWSKRVALILLNIGGVMFYVEHSPLKDTALGQTALYLFKGLIGMLSIGAIS